MGYSQYRACIVLLVGCSSNGKLRTGSGQNFPLQPAGTFPGSPCTKHTWHKGSRCTHTVSLHPGIENKTNIRWTGGNCHDCDIPPQPSHTCLCLLAVQTPPEHSLTKPEPIPGLPDPPIAFPNSSAAFPKGCCTDVCLVSIPEAVNTIPEHI